MSELDFEDLFKLQMVSMKFMLCHPETKLNKYWIINKTITMGPFIADFYFFSNSILYYLKKDEYFNAFNDSVPLTFFICTMFYFSMILVNRPTMRNLINSVKADYEKVRARPEREKSVVQDKAEKGKMLMIYWFVLMAGGGVIFLVKFMVLTTYHTHKNGNLTLIPFHEMHYPLNITERREHDMFLFVSTFIYETYFTFYAALLYFCAVPLGPIFMLHAEGQLEIIRLKFENIFEFDDVDERLKDIIQNMQYIYSFVADINQCFTLIYEIMLKQSMLLLPFTSYAMIQSLSHGNVTIEYGALFMQALLTCGMLCYYGDLLIQKSEDVRLAAYNCGWEQVYFPKGRSTLLIIMTRVQSPVAIETIFNQICLDTLTNVYRQAYTIFNLMTAMW